MGKPSTSITAAKDIYALGTILLEIGEWRSLRSLVESVVDMSKSDVAPIQLAKIRPFLLDESPYGGLGSLRYRMGHVYATVTKMMLEWKSTKYVRHDKGSRRHVSTGHARHNYPGTWALHYLIGNP
jgi:hypothetical protein